jgi:hypothetical protein
MRNIYIFTINHKHQRYDTAGDYYCDRDGTIQIRVSFMKDWKYGILVALHELIEFALLKHRGISEEEVTAFDIMFEKERDDGLHLPQDEPGADRRSPYRKEHKVATKIERIAAKALKVNWDEYGEEIMKL